MEFYTELDSEFFKFIEKHPTIQNLTLKVKKLSEKNLIRIATSLRLLKKIKFSRSNISAYDAIRFMSKLQYLETFSFPLDGDDDDYDEFQANLSNEWDCEKSGYRYVMVKRFFPLAKKQNIAI